MPTRRRHSVGVDAVDPSIQEGLDERSGELGVGLDAEQPVADPQHGNRAVVGCSDDLTALGQSHHLVLVHVLQSRSEGPRFHPRLRRLDRDLVWSDAPSGLGLAHLAAEGVRKQLVTEADADEWCAGVSDVTHERRQVVDPWLVVVHRRSRAGDQVGVEVGSCLGQFAVAGVDRHKFQPVGSHQMREHVAVVAVDGAETFVDVVALEQTDASHSGVT